jgi:hypothetical protein
MFGFARIIVSGDSFSVRFENVGHRARFDMIMDRFNQSFPLKEWDLASRTWRMPSSDQPHLLAFCNVTFGSKGCCVEPQATTLRR